MQERCGLHTGVLVLSLALGIAALTLVAGCGNDELFPGVDDPDAGTYVVSAEFARVGHRRLRLASESEGQLARPTCVFVGCSCPPPPVGWTVAPRGRSVLALRHGKMFVGPSKARLRLVASDSWRPVWSASGKKLAFVRGGDIWVIASDGTRLTQLTDSPSSHQDGCPAWLPGGHALAFSRWKESALP